MDTRYLDSFLQVAQLGSTAAAARRLNLTPTAVAQRIKALEQEIGTVLLSRAGRTMQLTAAGAALVAPANELLLRARDLRAIATQDAVAGDLLIGCITSALGYLVPHVLETLIASYEHLHPRLEPAVSTELYRKILSEEIDVALMVQPQFELPKEFVWRPLRDEPFVVLAHARLKGRRAERVLREEPFIRYHRRSWGGVLADRWLLEAGIRPKERFEIDALDAIAALVRGDLGVSLVPKWQPLNASFNGLLQLPLAGPGLSRPVGLLWRRNNARQRLIEVFITELFKQLSIFDGL